MKNKDCLKIGHINVNSVRHKFGPLSDLLVRSFLDILMVQETKLDGSFPNGQFLVDDFKMYRKDIKSDTGGILMYIRNDLAQHRRNDLEMYNCLSGRIETITVEVISK